MLVLVLCVARTFSYPYTLDVIRLLETRLCWMLCFAFSLWAMGPKLLTTHTDFLYFYSSANTCLRLARVKHPLSLLFACPLLLQDELLG